MKSKPEFHRLTESLVLWHRFDPTVKVDLFSTAIRTSVGRYLIDAISPEAEVLDFCRKQSVAGLVVTNANHIRSTCEVAKRLKVPIFAHAGATLDLTGDVTELHDGEQIAPELKVITIEGAAPGEIALHCTAEGGTLIFGDALINLETNGFAFLPRKYCLDQKLMRRSLQKVLRYTFRRILFAHGSPIVSQAELRLAELLRRTI